MSPRFCFSAALTLVLVVLACQSDKVVNPEPKNQRPTAVISAVRASMEGSAISFDGTFSSDPEDDTLAYSWSFGDGASTSGPIVSHKYADEGSYVTSLVVTDGRGGRDSTDAQVTIANASPVVTYLVVRTAAIGLGRPASILVGFGDPGWTDSLTATLDWGDQTTSDVRVQGSTLEHLYADTGTFSVTLTVRDNDGAVTTQTAPSVIVVSHYTNHPPIARLEGPATVKEGEAAVFSARASTDPDNDRLQYRWDYGLAELNFPWDTSSMSGRAYPDDGRYTVTVVVSDTAGASDTASAILTIVNAPPKVTSIAPPSFQPAGQAARTTVGFSDPGTNDSLTLIVRWGDGTTSSVRGGPRQGDALVHTYAKAGSYRVSATVRDNQAAEGSDTAKYSVEVFDNEQSSIAGYDVIDLGTFGGLSATPRDINDRGQVVGSSQTDSGATHAFAWENGTLRDLGTIGKSMSEAQRINEAGLIAGTVWISGDWEEHGYEAAIWQNGTGRTLGKFGEYGIRAVVVTETQGIVWNRYEYESIHGQLWGDGGWTSIEWNANPGESQMSDMNEHRQIVGGGGVHFVGESVWYHALLWESDSSRDLGVLGTHSNCDISDCSQSFANGINESGQIVGTTGDSLGKTHVVVWENGATHDLGVGAWSRAFINDRGQIAAQGDGQGFVWNNGTWRSIGSLGGPVEVVGLNESGQVVGTSMTAAGEQHVFVWSQSGGMIDLGTGPQAFTAAWAVDINARGDVIGYSAPCAIDPYDHVCRVGGYPYPYQMRAVIWKKR